MNEQVPSKESDYLAKLQDSHPMVQLQRGIEELRRDIRRWENAHKVVMAERDLWKGRAERINGLVLRLNADEGLSPGALVGLQRLARAAGGAAPEPKPAHEREPPHCSTCACGLAPEPPVCRCIPLADRPWKFCQDCGGLTQPPGAECPHAHGQSVYTQAGEVTVCLSCGLSRLCQ